MTEVCSRLCVKNLPAYLDENRLREHFSAKGEITDARIIKASDGHSRQFGFVGFKDVSEAQSALEYFNNSFIDSSRVSIQFAYQRGSDAASQAWSKYTPGTSAHSRVAVASGQAVLKQPTKSEAETGNKSRKHKRKAPEEDDPALRDFLQVMQPRHKAAIWSNDVAAAPDKPNTSGAKPPKSRHQAGQQTSAAVEESDSDDEYIDMQDTRTALPGEASDSGESEQHHDPAVADEAISDMAYLRSRMRKETTTAEDEAEAHVASSGQSSQSSEEGAQDDDKRSGSQEADEAEGPIRSATQDTTSASGIGKTKQDTRQHEASGTEAADELQQGPDETGGSGPEVVQASEAADQIGQTGRLFLRNLSYGATQDDLQELLGAHGELKEVHLVLDKTTRKSKGIALVQFAEAADAVAAHAALDGTVFQGRLLHILAGHRPPPSREQADTGDRTFKGQREAQRRATGGDRTSWNSLYMRPDTVADAVSAQLGITKSELLDSSHDDLAVRQALGEARVLAATKAALDNAGVALEELEAAAAAAGHRASLANIKRSSTTLLVKNLPFRVTEEELQEMFGKRGVVSRLVLPETRGLALVEFEEASEARAAFKGLAFRRLHHVPLYLEWAPAGIWAKSVGRRKAKAADVAESDSKTASTAKDESGGGAGAVVAVQSAADLRRDTHEADSGVDMHTLFVKNLAWRTGDAALKRAFEKAAAAVGGSIRSAKVAMRTDKKGADGKALSMGYGFVEASSESAAQALMKKLQGTTLDGHKLLIQLSQRHVSNKASDSLRAPPAHANAAKLVVRNVAFEASRKDIVGVFAPYGHIKSARLPNKFDGQHRGFAFVEFGSKQEAAAAMEATAGIHLYGRRLVLEPAGDDAGLDQLRAKTAAKFHDDNDEDAKAAKRLRHKLQMAEDEDAEPQARKKAKRKKQKLSS